MDECNEDADEDIAFITRAFKRVWKGNRDTPQRITEGNKDSKEIICYHYQKKGHIARNCFKKKAGGLAVQAGKAAMIATWGETDSDEDKLTQMRTRPCQQETCV